MQGRYNEAGDAVVMYFAKNNSLNMIQNDDAVDLNTIRTLFLLCNDYASRFTVSNDLDKAQMLLEKA